MQDVVPGTAARLGCACRVQAPFPFYAAVCRVAAPGKALGWPGCPHARRRHRIRHTCAVRHSTTLGPGLRMSKVRLVRLRCMEGPCLSEGYVFPVMHAGFSPPDACWRFLQMRAGFSSSRWPCETVLWHDDDHNSQSSITRVQSWSYQVVALGIPADMTPCGAYHLAFALRALTRNG